MCLAWVSKQTAVVSLKGINQLVFLMEADWVLCQVGTEVLYKVHLICLNKLQECVIHVITKKKVHKQHYQKRRVFEFNKRLRLTKNTPTIKHVTYNWNNTFTIQVSNLTTIELLLLNLQFTKMPKMSSTWIFPRMGTSDHRLSHTFRGFGEVEIGLTWTINACLFSCKRSWIN
jgi:hypothetical protein